MIKPQFNQHVFICSSQSSCFVLSSTGPRWGKPMHAPNAPTYARYSSARLLYFDKCHNPTDNVPRHLSQVLDLPVYMLQAFAKSIELIPRKAGRKIVTIDQVDSTRAWLHWQMARAIPNSNCRLPTPNRPMPCPKTRRQEESEASKQG